MESERPTGEPFRLLIVCTGNTCRSPLAEAIARDAVKRLGWNHVQVASAGVAASSGESASGGALRTAERHGLDLSVHRSTPLTLEAIQGADLILTMSQNHLDRLVDLGGGEKASLLTSFAAVVDPTDIPPSVPDPFGGPDESYEATFSLLERLIARALQRLAPMLAP